MKNVYAQIVKFNSRKDGSEHEAVQFVVHTPYGDYKSSFNFPSSLEFDIIRNTIEAENIRNRNALKDLGFQDEELREYEETDNNL